jgi:hypothetical protein
MEPSAISHPHKDPLFLAIEESGVELRDDFLILLVSIVHDGHSHCLCHHEDA